MRCPICGLALDHHDDSLSMNCGGDCWGCVGEIEADLGNAESIEKVRKNTFVDFAPGG